MTKRQSVPSNNPSGRPRSSKVTESIHASIWKLIDKSSYGDLTMESIAEKAGVSRTALYRRYPDVGQAVLGALLAVGASTLSMSLSRDIHTDLQRYFEAIIASLQPNQPIGKALRGVLAHALLRESFVPEFAEFIAKRREPVRMRLLTWKTNLPEGKTEIALDYLFGPVLYRMLIRQVPVSTEYLRFLIKEVLRFLAPESVSRDS